MAAAKMLLDSPATNPALRFGAIAQAFAAIIETSEPRFAIGIFGDWGSGKTTLMDAITARLSAETAIPVTFNAWRYEREPELLVPLLDTIRQGLVDWGDAHKGGEPGKRAITAAGRIGRVVRALVAGASVEVGVPGARVMYDPGKAVDQLRADAAEGEARIAAEEPQSLYFAGFQELTEALVEFGRDEATRIVVFVDDLDRCLPSNALDVLEAMKLFFDLPGFVFVVGLDEEIVERAVQTRFAELAGEPDGNGAAGAAPRPRTGGEYIKKLFQVPYSLPPMLAEQLDELLDAMYAEATLEDEQLTDLTKRVRKYLQYVARDGLINPREVKRFVNAYTLQTLVRPELNRDVVLALQTVAFRVEWEVAYDLILTDSAMFAEAARSFRDGDQHALEAVWPAPGAVPSDFARYVSSRDAEPLVKAGDLEPYLFSLQSTRSSQRWLTGAYQAVGALRRTVRHLREAESTNDTLIVSEVRSDLSEQSAMLDGLVADIPDEETASRVKELLAVLGRRAGDLAEPIDRDQEQPVAPIADALDDTIARLQEELRVVRRRSVLATAR